jgi:hypothetical protein
MGTVTGIGMVGWAIGARADPSMEFDWSVPWTEAPGEVDPAMLVQLRTDSARLANRLDTLCETSLVRRAVLGKVKHISVVSRYADGTEKRVTVGCDQIDDLRRQIGELPSP